MALAATCQAQYLATATKVDSLTTDAQVQEFVRARHIDYKEFTLTDTLGQECRELMTCLTSGSLSSWFKADFDGNGRTDVVVVGCESEYQQNKVVLCFLNQGYQQFREVRLSERHYDCAVPQRCFVKRQAAIRYQHMVAKGGKDSKRLLPVCQVDTLVFNKTHFIVYNPAPKDYHIQTVEFSASACYGTCPVFDLQLAKNGAATYHAKEYNEKKGVFTATVEAAPLRELWTLLNYLDLPKLSDRYAARATDGPGYTLKITYANGKTKTIRDYGEPGTFGLGQAYVLLFELRTTQKWK